MIIFGTLVTMALFPWLGLADSLVLAILLTPTDAALGKPMVSHKEIPEDIREGLLTESGLNDGIALPILLAVLPFSSGLQTEPALLSPLLAILMQIGIGVAVGAVIGWGGGKLVDLASNRKWMAPTYQRLASISLALLAYLVAVLCHGNGFVATFCAGLALATQTPAVRKRLLDFGEAEGEQLSLLTFLLFGSLMVSISYTEWTLKSLLYAVLWLTLIRLISVAIAFIGSKAKWPTLLFVSRFGRRGIASILFSVVILRESFISGHVPESLLRSC